MHQQKLVSIRLIFNANEWFLVGIKLNGSIA